MEGAPAGGAGDPPGQAEVTAAQGIGGDDRFLETEPAGVSGREIVPVGGHG